MKQKIGGADVDMLTKSELDSTMRGLQDWMVSVAKGVRPIRISARGKANGVSTTLELGGATTLVGGRMGPEPGFWWAVTRLAVRVDSQPAAFSLYLNAAETNSHVRDVDGAANGYAGFGAQELLVGNTDSLYLRASGLATDSTISVSGAAVEIPAQLLWKWLAG